MKNTSTGLIRITRIPAGEAPDYIRKVWVGLELPCDPILGLPDEGGDRGVMSRKPERSRYGFSVPQDLAIAILQEHRPDAAAYWKQQGYPELGGYFGFAEDEAVIIRGVTQQRIIEVPEEAMGDPSR